MKTPVWVVSDVLARDDYTLLITFASGEKRVYDARNLLQKPIYSRLTNIDYFLTARAEYGTVVWDDDVDIAPEHLYECSIPVDNMRKNAYHSLDEFKSQYTGIWNPSDGHWFGLDFSYRGVEYRFNTGSMYETQNNILADGREAVFGLYRKNTDKNTMMRYTLLEEFATLEEALESKCIEGIPFCEVIMDSDTELLGQD